MVNITSRTLGLLSVLSRTFLSFFVYFLSHFFNHPPKGNNGLSRFNFGTSQFRNLLYLAGYDPSQPPFAKPCGSGSTIGCYTIWDTSAIVCLSLASLISHACVAHESAASLLFYKKFPLCVVNSIILLTNGIRFAIQAVLLLMIGAWADYGTWRCAGIKPSY
jgi:hypothetical protein